MEQNDASEKQRRAIERLERMDDLGPSEKAAILCVMASMRPALFMTQEHAPKHDRDGTFHEEIDRISKVARSLGLAVEVVRDPTPVTWEEERHEIEYFYTDINIAKDEEALRALMAAHALHGQDEVAWDRAMGSALGYPATAIQAYEQKNFLRPDDIPEEIRDRPLMKFVPFSLSPDHWREELETVRPWAEAVKRLSPRIYAEVIHQEKH